MTHQVRPGRPDEAPQVDDLTSGDLEQVAAGGGHVGGVLVAMGDGSVRNLDSGDYNLWRQNYGSTV